MKQLYKNIYQFLLIASLLVGGIYFFLGCSSYEDDMIGSFPFLNISITDTSISNASHEIQIPVNANREWTASVEYVDGNSGWITPTPTNEYKTLTLSIKKNNIESTRNATVHIKNSSTEEIRSFTMTQEAVFQKIFNGLLIFKNQEELDNNTYTHVNGAVLIGDLIGIKNDPTTKAAGKTVEIQIGDSIYSVGSSNISDLSQLSTIRNISEKTLYVLNTQVSEIPNDTLVGLKLEKLYLDWNEITKIDNIQALQTITELSISNNKISNIDLLSTLKNIQQLNIAGNQIKDISVLSNMQQITHLTLGVSAYETNQIMDISVLNQLSSLENLSLSGLPIDEKQIDQISLPPNCIVVKEDLKGSILPLVTTNEPVSAEGQLLLSGSYELRDQDVTIESYGFYYGTSRSLEKMTFMEATINGHDFTATLIGLEEGRRYYIYAAVNTTEGRSLGELKTFGENHLWGDIFISTSADITNFQNEDYSSITGSIIIGSMLEYTDNAIAVLINNTYYYFSKNDEITNISFLADTKQINGGVYIVNTEVSNLTPLTQIDTTPILWLAKNKIESIPDLSSIRGLTTLSVSMNQIENIENISLLSGLTSLYLGDRSYPQLETNTIKDITPLHKLSNLRYLDISGLAISTPDINALRKALPECIIYAEGMATPQAPQVTTVEASDVTVESAILKGTILSQGDASITEYGFYFGSDTLNLEKIVISSPAVSNGSDFEHTVNNLQLNVSYFFKAFATNENGESIGEMLTFKAGNTYEGTLILRTQEEVNNFPNLGYNKINGDLIIGNAIQGRFDGYEAYRYINEQYYFANTDINNLDSLVSLVDVTQGVYIICNNSLSDISFVSKLLNTYLLDLERNNIYDWTPVNQMFSLERLNVPHCNITDLSLFTQLTHLTDFNCSYNQISDISALENHTSLTSLTLDYNPIQNIDPLKKLSNLSNLHLNGLPLSETQVEELRTSLPNCTINSQDLKEYAPVLGSVAVKVVDETTVTLQAEITNWDVVYAITERGFFYGTESNLESMTQVQTDNIWTDSYRLSGLDDSTTYYVRAYASNAWTTTYSETAISFQIQTARKLIVETIQVESSNSYVEGSASNADNAVTSYGAVWSLVGEPTINSYIGINRTQNYNWGNVTWSLELIDLKAGYTYNVRCFAENDYGLVYGEVIQYTAPGEPTKYDYTLNSTIPSFDDGTASPINQLYTYSYKTGIANSGEVIAPTSVASNKYVYPLAEGEQQLLFCNLNASNDSYQIENSASQDIIFKIKQTNGENGIGTDIVTGIDSLTLTSNHEETIEFKREVARLNLSVKATDKDGSMVENISELLSHVEIIIGGFYSELQILSDLKSQRGGSISNSVGSNIDATGFLHTVAENIYTFPTIDGKKNKVEIKVDLKDGRSIKLASFLPQAIEANKIYSITFTISDNKTDNSFTLDDIEIVEEIIEF